MFDLFNTSSNLLPFDGLVEYYPSIWTKKESDAYLKKLIHTLDWENDEVILFGKKLTTRRKVAWYGDQNYAYTYSKITKYALPWTKELIEIKNKVETTAQEKFNSCLINLYHDGQDGMGWHRDNEKDLKENGTIASVSFGSDRVFQFKHITKEVKYELILNNGSILLMKNETQKNWLHALPKSKKITTQRINLTFRNIV